ncbi:MAG: CRISPR-associated endonuclease Cas6 [Thermoleophilia bacterium]
MKKQEVLIRRLLIHTNKTFVGDGADLRRAVTARFKDISILHNHNGEEYDYRSPRVRYLVLNGVPQIASFGPGTTVLEYLYRERFALQVGHVFYEVTGVELRDDLLTLGVNDGLITYKSQSPWIALNQKNHRVFNGLTDQAERRQFLERILVGNYLSFCKTLGIFVEKQIIVYLDEWIEVAVKSKGIPMRGFVISFRSNMLVPLGLGLGKWTAKGFGLMDNQIYQKQDMHLGNCQM